jgi:two-component system response regulator HydG
MAHILIIDDNPMNAETFADALSSEGHHCYKATSGEEGLALLTGAAVDCVLCDYKLPNLNGLETMELAQERTPGLPWILITGHGTEEIAVQAIKQGAFNYLSKPVDLTRLLASVESAARAAATAAENRNLKRELGHDEALQRIVGTSTAVKNMRQVIKQVAGTDATVLIEGESGTGKELVADAIAALSRRSGCPYVKINAAAIPHDLLESELFGHERGAFTGAVQQKQGKFEQADGGTLFLDEIGEMSLDAQVKLLRVLQDGTFNRVGGNEQLSTDVRLVCATNRQLKQEVLANRFRMDLFYRLNVVNIRVPSLHERREDIPLLAQHFIERLSARHRQEKQASPELLMALRRREWPGNIRELENTLERLFVLAPTNVIGTDMLDDEMGSSAQLLEPVAPATPAHQPPTSPSTEGPGPSAEEAIVTLVGLPLDEVERRMILATLEHCRGNKSKTARLLNIGLKTLYRKLASYESNEA